MIKYNPELKLFSPAWDRKKYISHVKGYSDEFCHNLVRMIMRPNSESSKHWFSESITWLDDGIGIKLEIRRKPVWYLFSFILDKNTEDFPIGINLDWMIRKVTRESMYGQVTNSDRDIIESSIRTLYKSINPMKTYTGDEVFELFNSWFLSIPNNHTIIEKEL